MASMVNVLDVCQVTTSPAVTQTTGTTKGTGKRFGTRVFKYRAEDYCHFEYEHDDGEWAIFICFQDNRVNEAIAIIKTYPGESRMFQEDKQLARLGGFYQLKLYQDFGKDHMNEVKAVLDGRKHIKNWTDVTLNGWPWSPCAEVLQGLAAKCSFVYPSGNLVSVDFNGVPNMSASDPYRLDFMEDPSKPPKPPQTDNMLKKQQSSSMRNSTGLDSIYPPFGPNWTRTTIHIHPLGQYVKDPKNPEECFEVLKFAQVDVDSMGYTSGYSKNAGYGVTKQSTSDWEFLNNTQNDNKNIYFYRSIIVDRFFIYLYNKMNDLMIVRRKEPDLRYFPK